MSLRNRNPSEPRRSDQPIKRIISQFNGMISGEPDTKIPSNYCKKNTNTIDRGGYFDIRGGSNRYYDERLVHFVELQLNASDDYLKMYSSSDPSDYFRDIDFTGDAFRFYGTTLPKKVSGGYFDTTTIYYMGFDLVYPAAFRIYPTRADAIAGTNRIQIDGTVGIPSYGESSKIAFEHTYIFDHVKAGKLIIVEGSAIYVTNKDIGSGYISDVLNSKTVFKYGTLSQRLYDISSIVAYGDNAILTSKDGGIWKIILSDSTHYYMYQINNSPPVTLIPNINYSVSLTFGYLYTHTLCRITGTGNRDRTSDGALLQYETGTCKQVGTEQDYGEVYFATAVGVVLTNYHIIGQGNPNGISINGNKVLGMTHIGLYRTKDIGPAGSAPTAAAVGNKRDYMIWVADIPICKPMVIRTDTAGHAKWVSGMKFVRGDVGSKLYIQAGVVGGFVEITGWVSETDVTIAIYAGDTFVIPSSAACSACIGSARFAKASQTDLIVQLNATEYYGSSLANYYSVGGLLFLSDGTTRHIKGIDVTQNSLTVHESGNFTNLTVAICDYVGSGVVRAWNDTIPDAPQANGRVSWDDRKEFGTDLYIPRRFFIPLPNCDILHLSNGFMMTAVRDGSQYDYCQTGDKEYTIGHYKYPEQSRRVTGSIQHVIGMGDKVIILMKNKTGIVSLSSSQNIGRTEVGEDIFQLPEISVVDDNKGVIAWKLITFKNANILFALTSDGAFRYFDGSMWSAADLGFVNGLDAVSKEYLKRIDHSAAYGADYNANGGIKLWAKRIVGGVSEDICLRFSTDSNEGQGWSIIEGTHWVEPMESFGVFTILDDNGVQRCLVIDKNDHFIYEIDTFDRITRERKYVLDKTGVQNAEIPWSKRFREEIVDLGSQNKRLKHQQSYVNVMPEYVEDRGKTGYTATGIRNAQELTLKAFEDGEQSTAAAQTNDFPEDGELVYSGRRVEASRIATELSGTAGEIRITGIVNEFLAENRGPSADKRINTEAGLEEELNQDLIYHACRANIDRVSGDSLGTGVTFITGPDGRSRSGMTFTGVRSIAITGATHTILLWSKDTNLFTGIAGFTAYGVAVSGWTLYYKKTAIATATIELMAGDKADIRIYDKTITDAAIADLYADTVTFEGKRHLPGFRMTEDL